MRDVDRVAMELGLTLTRMMENAGANLAWLASGMLGGEVSGRRITVLAGPGGNGGGGLVAARRDPEQLQRVLFNLIQNAIRHTPKDGSIVARAEPAAGPTVEIEVADSGAGIDPPDRHRIFEPYVQGPSRVAGENGSAGLGLAIARAIVTAHGGQIWLAQSALGTRIRFSLPTA